MDEALPEVGIEAPSDGGLYQAFPADPHDTFGSARSHRSLPPQLLGFRPFLLTTPLQISLGIEVTQEDKGISRRGTLQYPPFRTPKRFAELMFGP